MAFQALINETTWPSGSDCAVEAALPCSPVSSSSWTVIHNLIVLIDLSNRQRNCLNIYQIEGEGKRVLQTGMYLSHVCESDLFSRDPERFFVMKGGISSFSR